MGKLILPAHGWLPPGAHLEFKQDDAGKDFATNWQGVLQAPGNGECLLVPADAPFPAGFGPHYPVLRIDTGPWAAHDGHPGRYYLGHTSSRVVPGERFGFGHTVAVADQGHNWLGTQGGWVEFGEWFANGPGPHLPTHWFDDLLRTPLVVEVPDPPLVFGDQGVRVLHMSEKLRDCGYLSRRWWHFNRPVHGAVVRFKRHHHLKVEHGIVDHHTEIVLAHSAQWCRRHHRREV